MQSNGGIISAEQAAREPVRTILSGPAGGVIGASHAAELARLDKCISFDMGGTSTDVALLTGELRTTSEAIIAGLPVAVPMLEIHTVGAGGGSIARSRRGRRAARRPGKCRCRAWTGLLRPWRESNRHRRSRRAQSPWRRGTSRRIVFTGPPAGSRPNAKN